MGWLDTLTQVDSTIMDARGRRVNIRWNEFDPDVPEDLDSDGGVHPDSELWRSYRRSLRQVQSAWYHLLMSGVIMLLGAVGALGTWLVRADHPLKVLLFGAMAIACFAVAWRHPRWRRRQVWVMRCHLVGSNRCFACGYRMSGIGMEQDGCAVCPECGAAWQVQA